MAEAVNTTSMIDWGAQSVRASYFAIPTKKRVDELFEQAIGQKPDAYQSTPGAPAQASASLPLGQMVLTVTPGRFDLILNALPTPILQTETDSAPGYQHASINEVDKAVELIVSSMVKLGSELTLPQRCAVALDLNRAADNNDHANSILNSILPYGLTLTNERDFVLQRNDLTSFGIFCDEVNVISRWAVNNIQQMTFNVSPIPGMPAPGMVVASYFVAQKFIDINTRSPLKLKQASQIYQIYQRMKQMTESLRQIS